jgi:hypothetical protein
MQRDRAGDDRGQPVDANLPRFPMAAGHAAAGQASAGGGCSLPALTV